MKIQLNSEEIAILNKQDPSTAANGGFQSLMVRLQNGVNIQTGEIDISSEDLTRLPQYAFDYANGGWQGRLVSIFGRALGDKLGR